MKLVEEVIDSVLILETEDENIKLVVDIKTGEVLHFEFIETDIHKLAKFMGRAKTRYSRFLRSEKINDFKLGEL